MAKNYSYKGTPIDPLTAKITMIFLGLVLVSLSFVLNDIVIAIQSKSITYLVIGIVLIVSSVISYIELGLKRWTDWSKLMKFQNQQLLSFTIATLVLISGIMNIFGFNVLGFWNSGSVFMSGAIIILEAIR